MTTLSGKPSMPTAWSAQVHGKVQPLRPSLWGRIRAMLCDDAAWEPTYRSLVAAVLAVWITVLLIGVAAWMQFSSTPVTPTGNPSSGTTAPHNNPGLGVAGEGGGK